MSAGLRREDQERRKQAILKLVREGLEPAAIRERLGLTLRQWDLFRDRHLSQREAR